MRYTYVRQHDTTDCAAACLAMVCLHYKKEITITRLRDMMGTDLKGTNLTGMEKAAQELGFSTAAVRVDRENFLSEFTTPCIAQVITDEGLAHFVTVFKKTTIKDDGERRRHMLRQEEERKKCADEGKKFRCRDYVIIGDPAKELKKISLDEFYKNFTGVLLLMTPTSEFKTGKQKQGSMVKRFLDLLLPQKKLPMQPLTKQRPRLLPLRELLPMQRLLWRIMPTRSPILPRPQKMQQKLPLRTLPKLMRPLIPQRK